jgi:hypothetical protein
MSAHWVYLLIAIYAVVGLVIFRLSRRPTCRVCVLRAECPNRPAVGLPVCVRRSIRSKAKASAPEI